MTLWAKSGHSPFKRSSVSGDVHDGFGEGLRSFWQGKPRTIQLHGIGEGNEEVSQSWVESASDPDGSVTSLVRGRQARCDPKSER